MSSTAKTLLIVLVIIILGGLAYWLLAGTSPTAPTTATSTAATATTPTANTPPTTDLTTSNSDDSDAALSQDSTTISGQMSGLNSDNANTDSSLNDQAGAQSY